MLRFSVLIPACLLWLFALSGNAFAQTEITVDSGYTALDQFLNHLDSLQASFSQSVRDGRNRVIDTSAGTLMIKRPGKLGLRQAQCTNHRVRWRAHLAI